MPIRILSNGIVDFSEIIEGDEAELSHTITQADVDVFANLTGDVNALHVNDDFARKTTFGRPVAHGMLSAAFISTLIGTLLPGNGALWMSQTLEFVRPTYIGDTLHIHGRVRKKSPGPRILVLNIEIRNQLSQKVIVGEAKVKILDIMEKKTVEDQRNKATLIIGGSRGIGAAIAHRLAQDGYRVAVNYAQSQAAAESIVTEIETAGQRAIAIKANIVNRGEVEKMVQQVRQTFGSIDSVVFCAAPESALTPFEQLSWEMIQRQLNVQIKGAYHCVQTVLPQMVEKRAGSIVFISSIAADGTPPPHQLDYVVAKAALSAMARSLAVEYGPKGIRVNIISPGMTQTERITHMPEKARLLAKATAPLRQLATPEDIAHTVAFLLSPAAQHITGETIRVAGGTVMI